MIKASTIYVDDTPMNDTDQFARFKQYHDKEDLVEEVIRIFYNTFLSRSESVAIDCGSHKGFHTFPLLRCCRQVIGIDANEEMCVFLAEKVNAMNIDNCRIIHAAVQDDEKLKNVTFYVSDNFPGRSSLTRLWNAIDAEVTYRQVVAPATILDRLAEEMQLSRVDFIKLDLEGGEYKALRGAVHMLERHNPLIVMENSIHAAKQGGFLETDPFDFLTSIGYVLLAPNGIRVTRDRLFPFWYLFGIPGNKLDKYRDHLINAYNVICSSRELY